jgi:hypothetical protein
MIHDSGTQARSMLMQIYADTGQRWWCPDLPFAGMTRAVPFNDPRMCGDHFNPNVFLETETVMFVIDREQGVILEWLALIDGEDYERH